MKKLFILPVIIGLLISTAFAAGTTKNDDDKSANVSYAAVNQFNSDFRNASNVRWTVTANSQKVDFVIDNVKKTAFYSFDGTYLGTTQKVNYDVIPSKAKKEIAEKYKGYNVGDVIELQTSDNIQHFVDLKSEKAEILVRVAPTSVVYFFQQVK
ncbi:hypothetical protein DJ568_16990 [Mucilaginibacter hurinus]|uniref:Beta-lactamase-inhibitor-like PepSY-like domain-containing protein n=1 Tax=Mucilaginibacter hurinus TaxID=2201324 RepID=A0A367GJF4_9SPHI|nr:hypothetical protein [Mucilaginibacter hurinus]RCH53599.1 hypothetical protein DJ568_16990 [Mucilaginibacter hurinus]